MNEARTVYRAKKHSKKRSIVHVFYNFCFYAMLILLVASALIFAGSENPDKSLFGYRFYYIETGSMAPGAYSAEKGYNDGFNAGDMIIVRLCEPESVKTGDIICFVPGQNPSVFLTHRVVSVQNGENGLQFITRGDANNANDSPISASALIGKKIYTIPKIGRAMQFFKANTSLSIIVVISFFTFIYAVFQLFNTKKEPNNE